MKNLYMNLWHLVQLISSRRASKKLTLYQQICIDGTDDYFDKTLTYFIKYGNFMGKDLIRIYDCFISILCYFFLYI